MIMTYSFVLALFISPQLLFFPKQPTNDQFFPGYSDVSFSSSAKYFATTTEGVIAIWNTKTKKKLIECQQQGNKTSITKIFYEGDFAPEVCFDPTSDDILYFGSQSGIHKWEWKIKPPHMLVKSDRYKIGKYPDLTCELSCTVDGKWLAFINWGKITLIDLKAPKRPKIYLPGKGLPDIIAYHVRFSKSSDFLFFSDSQTIKRLDLRTMKVELLVPANGKERIGVFAVSPSGEVIAYSNQSGEIMIYRTKRRNSELLAKLSSEIILGLSPNEKLLAVDWGEKPRTITLFSVDEKRTLSEIRSPKGGLLEIDFLNDNSIYGIDESPTIQFWAVGRNGELKKEK